MNDIIEQLEAAGYRVIMVIGASGGNLYQLKKDGITYPQAEPSDEGYAKSKNGSTGIPDIDIEYHYSKHGLDGVIRLFKPLKKSKLPIYTQKAKSAYRERNTSVTFTINVNSEADVLEWLNRQSNKSGAIKSLIRQAAAREKHQ